ncbi:MAG: hypothetical protein OHK0052_15020 [Anaerolineales bacterium]
MNPAVPKLRAWRELALLAQTSMEVCWIAPWVRALAPSFYATSPSRTFFTLLACMLSAQAFARALNFLNLRRRLRQTAAFICLGAVTLWGGQMLLGTPTPPLIEIFLALLIALLVSLRGAGLASSRVGPQVMLSSFQVGITMLALFVFVNTLVTGETPGNLLYLFLFLGLVAVGAARFAVLGKLRGGRDHPLAGRWLASLLLSAGLVVLLAAVSVRAAQNQFLSGLTAFFEGIFIVLIALAFTVLLPLVLLLVLGLQNLLSALRVEDTLPLLVDTLQKLVNGLAGTAFEILQFLQAKLPWLSALKVGALWAILLGALLWGGVWLAARRFLPDAASDGESRDSLWQEADFWARVRQRASERIRRGGAALWGARHPREQARNRAARQIRQMYRELLLLSAQLDVPRENWQTPWEFLPALQARLENVSTELRLMTQAYVRARYGELPETAAELAELQTAWLAVQTEAARLLRMRSNNTNRV